jgi:hypothetical protein
MKPFGHGVRGGLVWITLLIELQGISVGAAKTGKSEVAYK